MTKETDEVERKMDDVSQRVEMIKENVKVSFPHLRFDLLFCALHLQ